jgi:hypothetical protein
VSLSNRTKLILGAAFWLIAMAAQLSNFHSTPVAMIFALCGIGLFLWAAIHHAREARAMGKRILEPQHLIVTGLGGVGVFALIACAGFVWQWRSGSITSTSTILDNKVKVSPINLVIKDVGFPNNPETQFIVNLHIANTGAPSTVKDFVLAIYKGGQLYEQFPPREAIVPPRLASSMTTIERGVILRSEPLLQGQEVDASINYQIPNNAKNEVGRKGLVYRITATDIYDSQLEAEYTIE